VRILLSLNDFETQPIVAGVVTSPAPPGDASLLLVVPFPSFSATPPDNLARVLQTGLTLLANRTTLGGLELRSSALGYRGFYVASEHNTLNSNTNQFHHFFSRFVFVFGLWFPLQEELCWDHPFLSLQMPSK